MTIERPAASRLEIIGNNATPIWGISAAERIRRIAARRGNPDGDGVIVASADFAFDPLWYDYIAARPNMVLTLGGKPVLANVGDPAPLRTAIEAGERLPDGLAVAAVEDGITIYNSELRKRERPFVEELRPDTVRGIERASYFGAYKGVTDILTKYLWPEWALVLTGIATRIGMTPNMVTAIGAALCVWATFLFADGHYWAGMAAALVFMVFDTVDGKLARCTITSSKWGEAFDHGIDLVHPPFWWYAWGVGLEAHGLALAPAVFWTVMAVMVAGYVLQRLIEGYFIVRMGMHIHVWEKFDTDFRLITARRNPNMVILFVSLLFARPDIGLLAVTGWTVISLVVHLVRMLQAMARKARGEALTSWLSDGAAA